MLVRRAAVALVVTTLVTTLVLSPGSPAVAATRKRKPPRPASATKPADTAKAATDAKPQPATPTTPATPATPPKPKGPGPGSLTAEAAAQFANLALRCIDRPYPYKSDRVLDSAEGAREPRLDHPVFYGCFDWHSAVHAHWLLVRLARVYPDEPFAAKVREALAARFTEDALLGETTFMSGQAQTLFERPYGWAWAVRLVAELRRWDDPQAREWVTRMEPLERLLVARVKEYLPKLAYPVRAGTHANTAFALSMVHDYAQLVRDDGLLELVPQRIKAFYANDQRCPVDYEPSGEDFFSPCLLEADAMRRVLGPAEFGEWLKKFLPGLETGEVGNLAKPAVVTDPSDGRIVHLDGLNLVRAWTMKGVAAGLAPGDPRRKVLWDLAKAHADAGQARVMSGHYEGEHWLASFAVFLATDAWR